MNTQHTSAQGARAGMGFNKLLREVRHRQGGWGHSLDHPLCLDKSQNLGFWYDPPKSEVFRGHYVHSLSTHD